LDDVCILDCESIHDCMIKPLLALAYPLLVWFLFMLFFYFCDDHQFIEIDGSRCERYSWSTRERWFRGIVYLGWTSCDNWAFLLGQWSMYCMAFELYFENFVVIPLCFNLVSWCALVTVRSCDCTSGLRLYINLCDSFLLIWFIN